MHRDGLSSRRVIRESEAFILITAQQSICGQSKDGDIERCHQRSESQHGEIDGAACFTIFGRECDKYGI